MKEKEVVFIAGDFSRHVESAKEVLKIMRTRMEVVGLKSIIRKRKLWGTHFLRKGKAT